MMKYPPVWQMLVVFASGEDKAWLDKVMDAMAECCKAYGSYGDRTE